MKQFILLFFACLTVLLVQAQVRVPVVGQVPQTEKESALAVEQEEQDISVYPNPSTGIFTVSLANTDAKTAELRIMNVIGNEIYREKLVRNDAQFSKTIDLNSFAKGLYYVKLEADNFSAIRRVVVK
ncbi:T9SS type A sorting domain-containing protein [Pontibacter sp. SGAir0037]|uniref:T9SS type A sorting domain-containing protein n=1 Tax=Pontibacter sp. SGAir0037 TaxID=2571030 RepID=UPI0010CD513A|nr:T9SS type A sorting domain-containing protein [Pontibacter sp. SGAir0037]QCR23794.1 PKD domain-containing protein [Pontibacter sp. SGAir0037]